MHYIDTAEVARMVRAELKKAFPETTFSVKSKRYAGGSSIDVRWTNGPTEEEVKAIAGEYHGSEFDGMQDLQTYNGRPYGNDYIFFSRTITEEHYSERAEYLCQHYAGLENIDPKDLDAGHREILDHWGCWSLRQLAWREFQKIPLPN